MFVLILLKILCFLYVSFTLTTYQWRRICIVNSSRTVTNSTKILTICNVAFWQLWPPSCVLIRTFTNVHKIIIITLMYCLFANTFSETLPWLCAHCCHRLSLSSVIASAYIAAADDRTSIHCLVRRFDWQYDSALQLSTISLSFRTNMQVTSRNTKDVGLVYPIAVCIGRTSL
jgi:hypothetical protein